MATTEEEKRRMEEAERTLEKEKRHYADALRKEAEEAERRARGD